MSASVAVCTKLPDVPRTVTVPMPIGAVLLTVSVRVLVPVVGLVPNDAVTPLGKAVAEKFTLPVKPLFGVTVMVLVPDIPWVMVMLLGDTERRKFGPEVGQLLTRLAALTLPIPEAKSHPNFAGYAGLYEESEVESTPTAAPSR